MADNPVPAFDDVIAYWNACRGERFAPAWADIDMMALPSKLLPYCIVVDMPDDGRPIRYRYYGSGIADLHGMELTNKTVDDLEPPGFRAHVIGQYAAIAEGKAPKLFATRFQVKSGLVLQHAVLRLPISDDGETVTKILTVEDFDDRFDELKDYFTAMARSAN